jgi:hypothetical protein
MAKTDNLAWFTTARSDSQIIYVLAVTTSISFSVSH